MAMVAQLFRAHGEMCASHPWEVIVATLTLTACMLTVDQRRPESVIKQDEYNAVVMIIMTAIRCFTVLYCYYQFCNLHKLGSKYILGIAGLFTVFSSFVFSSSVINLMQSDVSDLKDALFFYLLLIDLPKASLLAQFALSSNNQEEVKYNIARGMEILGPTITLDRIVESLVIGVGTLSGVRRLEELCCFACLSAIVNYVVFMTFYPACVSLILELSRCGGGERPAWHNKSFISSFTEQDQKPNPVVQRVKMIMSAGLMLVHAHSRWTFSTEGEDIPVHPLVVTDHNMLLASNQTDSLPLHDYIMKWLNVSAEHIVILILLLALAIKFIFFEDKEELLMSENCESQDIAPVSAPDNLPCMSDGMVEIKSPRLEMVHRSSQTMLMDEVETESEAQGNDETTRSLEVCLKIYNEEGGGKSLTDSEVLQLVQQGSIPAYQIEKAVKDPVRGVGIRRKLLKIAGNFPEGFFNLPYENYDYSKVLGACCENVIGYMPVPVGVAGPLLLDGKKVYVPMATTEGCLVASTNRGSRALMKCGVTSRIVADGMTRGPVVRFPNVSRASEAMLWMQVPDNYEAMKKSFDSTSRYARLTKLHIRIAGRHLFIRFVATTGDAMGMNMLSKGTEEALNFVQGTFPDMEILSLSGNFCTDKKPAAVNWIEGRGKSVVCEAVVPAEVVKSVLKTTVQALVDVNITKNLIGSAVAGSIGGFNAHAANIVTAIFIATGQDPAQNVGSSNCMTLMEPWGEEDLYVSCTMPSIEIGTVGGGTILPPQAACLEMLGVRGPNEDCPGENANRLARIVCGTVLAGELSLMSALAAGHLVRSHLRHNRSSVSSFPGASGDPPCKS